MPTGQRATRLLSLSVITVTGDVVAELRVSSQISGRRLKSIVKEAMKPKTNLRLNEHDLVYENSVLDVKMTLHASKVKNGSTLTYINKTEFDDSGDEMPVLVDYSSEPDVCNQRWSSYSRTSITNHLSLQRSGRSGRNSYN